MKSRALICVWSLAVGAVFATAARATDLPGEFAAANKFYAEGKYAAAAGTYEKTIQQMKAEGHALPGAVF